VIEDVRNFKSEIGILYLDDFNKEVMVKLLKESNLVYEQLFACRVYVYLSAQHPLAQKQKITFEELSAYPCLSFDQGKNNSFYFSEEVLSTYEYDRMIKVNDRGTMLNMMIGLNGYTLCSGIICADLNGMNYRAVPLEDDEVMNIVCIRRAGASLSQIGKKYLEHLKEYENEVMR
jgi:DNA-binding transcriptional LysR family regulator